MGNDLNSYQSPFAKPVVSVPSADFSGILLIVFLLLFIAWGIYTATVSYHWWRYGHRSWLAIPAIVVHVVISALCILLIASGV